MEKVAQFRPGLRAERRREESGDVERFFVLPSFAGTFVFVFKRRNSNESEHGGEDGFWAMPPPKKTEA